MNLLAVDPGACAGYAYFTNGTLFAAGLLPCELLPHVLVIEIPQIYTLRTSKADPNDIITLAVSAGEVIGRVQARGCQRVIRVRPHEWKGAIPKEVHHARLLKSLTPRERRIVEALKLPKSKVHNVWDAIGIGKWALERVPRTT